MIERKKSNTEKFSEWLFIAAVTVTIPLTPLYDGDINPFEVYSHTPTKQKYRPVRSIVAIDPILISKRSSKRNAQEIQNDKINPPIPSPPSLLPPENLSITIAK